MKLLGLNKKQAIEYLHEHNLDYRIMEDQPELTIRDQMFNASRFNLTIENDIVVKVEKF